MSSTERRTLLSFPPDARSWWSVDHLSPHTSCLWPWSRRSDCRGGVLMSLWRIIRSLLPEDSWSAFHARAPAREGGKRCERAFGGPAGRAQLPELRETNPTSRGSKAQRLNSAGISQPQIVQHSDSMPLIKKQQQQQNSP